MDKLCNPDNLYERKFDRDKLPIQECRECLFNILCNDYIIYGEQSPSQVDKPQGEKDVVKSLR